MTLIAAIARLQVHAGSLSGVKYAPAYPPESADAYPFAIAYPESGVFQRMTDWDKGLHTIVVEIHVNPANLPTAVAAALPYIEAYPALLLADPTLAGAVQTIQASEEAPLTYKFGRMSYAGVDTIGVQFKVTVKI